MDELSNDECEGVSDGLLLLRNILHIAHQDAGIQNQILWNLFAHSLDKILLHLMTCSQKNKWGIAVVQLIALIYKDQHVSNLQKLLNEWLENSMSESSEDNESNTSPPDLVASRGDSSSEPTLTSDPTSDSSDTGSRRNKCAAGTNAAPKSFNGIGGIVENSEPNNTQSVESVTRSEPAPVSTSTTHIAVVPSTTTTSSSRNVASPVLKEPSQPPVSQKAYSKSKNKGKGKSGKERLSDVDSGISSSHFSTEKNHVRHLTSL